MRRPLPRDRRIVRCPAGCGGWVYDTADRCPFCHAWISDKKEKP